MRRKLELIIFFQSLVATLGSLYYSTFGDPIKNFQNGNIFNGEAPFEPCNLCWYARILMYPITIITAIAMYRKDRNFTYYTAIFSYLGILLEIYHYSLQKLNFSNIFQCTFDNPCNAMEVNYLGFITIPFLCLIAFTIVFISSILHIKKYKNVD